MVRTCAHDVQCAAEVPGGHRCVPYANRPLTKRPRWEEWHNACEVCDGLLYRLMQMRVEMGILQMEVAHRPDGTRPHGNETYFDYAQEQAFAAGEDFELSEEQCNEVDREFVQFYHRRICWLALREFKRAAADADHT